MLHHSHIQNISPISNNSFFIFSKGFQPFHPLCLRTVTVFFDSYLCCILSAFFERSSFAYHAVACYMHQVPMRYCILHREDMGIKQLISLRAYFDALSCYCTHTSVLLRQIRLQEEDQRNVLKLLRFVNNNKIKKNTTTKYACSKTFPSLDLWTQNDIIEALLNIDQIVNCIIVALTLSCFNQSRSKPPHPPLFNCIGTKPLLLLCFLFSRKRMASDTGSKDVRTFHSPSFAQLNSSSYHLSSQLQEIICVTGHSLN